MIRVAEVEDDEKDYENYIACLNKYKEENEGVEVDTTWFKTSEQFLSTFTKNKFDIIFMDINLGESNGMEISKRIREIDDETIIIFVSNLAQYAVEGYEVEAMDFIVKPMTYYVFSMKFKRALKKIAKKQEILLPFIVNYEKSFIKASTIQYIEIIGHKMIIHTTQEEKISYGTIKSVEELLEENKIDFFGRCNNYSLVNYNYINGVFGYQIKVGNNMLDISHPRKAKFMQDFNKFLGKGGL